jgi:hypothetical protein
VPTPTWHANQQFVLDEYLLMMTTDLSVRWIRSMSMYPRSHSKLLALEVEIVNEEEQFGDDYCLIDVAMMKMTRQESSASKHYNRALVFAESEMYDECLGQHQKAHRLARARCRTVLILTELYTSVMRGADAEKFDSAYQGILAHACNNTGTKK